MFRLLSNVSEISNSVSTVYRQSELPKQEILQQYKKRKSHVFCTGYITPRENHCNYGIVKHTFDIINDTVDIELIGNANEV